MYIKAFDFLKNLILETLVKVCVGRSMPCLRFSMDTIKLR